MLKILFRTLFVIFLGLAPPVASQDSADAIAPPPGARDTCPVCGMFVAMSPEWAATVLWKNGKIHHFDGAKDLFKYLLKLDKYAPGYSIEDVETVAVTGYYDLKRIHARDAFYVIGSDVHGPMGHELVPLATRADADEFMRDHKGERILRFDEITWDLLIELDKHGM